MTRLTISLTIDSATQQLNPHFDTARLDAEVLIAHALNLSRTQLYTWSDRSLSDVECVAINSLIDRRCNGEPIAYIVGHQEFWSLDFKVTPDTLIPRPETEHLVELALANIPVDKAWRIADLGTGTGAIAIAIAKERAKCQVLAVDESETALFVAKENAETLGVANVSFMQSDWFASLFHENFDLIVSNPPYIEAHDKHLSQGDVAYEPKSALASGLDGLDDIRHIISQAKTYLRPGAMLFVEHGWDQAIKVRALFKEGMYDNVCSHKDLAGFERITAGEK